MQIHNCVKFHPYSFCGCQVKNFKKFLVLIQHPWNGPFWVFFGPLLHQILFNFPEIFSRGSIKAEKNSFLQIFRKKQIFAETRSTQNLPHFNPLFPSEGGQNKKINIFQEYYSHLAIQIWQNQGSISSPLSRKNMITFCSIWAIFSRKQGIVTHTRAGIKI